MADIHFLKNQIYYYARDSFEEIKARLRKLIRRNLVKSDTINKIKELIDELGPKLNAFITKTNA